jgi:hypothetical protein
LWSFIATSCSLLFSFSSTLNGFLFCI